ncbi:MAG: hypothetical protein IJX81_07530 [Clostridia bacterium]|nr:hypothetical protein [Clostridia bacterium]
MDVLIFGGQSNMQGQTESLPFPNEPVHGALEYRYLRDELISLQHPVGEDVRPEKWIAAASGGNGSLVPALCREYVRLTGREVIAIHAARGSTTVAEWRKGTQHYYYAKKKILAGLEKARQQGTIEHVYYVWLQGESDAYIETPEEEYLQSLIGYKNDLKSEFSFDKFCLIKVGYFAALAGWIPGSVEEKTARDVAIMRAQERAVKTDEDFVMLTRLCPILSKDEKNINPYCVGHYNNAAMELIGNDAAKALASL